MVHLLMVAVECLDHHQRPRYFRLLLFGRARHTATIVFYTIITVTLFPTLQRSVLIFTCWAINSSKCFTNCPFTSLNTCIFIFSVGITCGRWSTYRCCRYLSWPSDIHPLGHDVTISLFMKFWKAGLNQPTDSTCSHTSLMVPLLKEFLIHCNHPAHSLSSSTFLCRIA